MEAGDFASFQVVNEGAVPVLIAKGPPTTAKRRHIAVSNETHVCIGELRSNRFQRAHKLTNLEAGNGHHEK